MYDPFVGLSGRYLSTRSSLRNVVRHTLVGRQLEAYLPPQPARVADVGGGSGHQTIPLARRGYEVTILDPSQAMLEEARRNLSAEDEDTRGRVRLVEGEGEQAAEALGAGRFDAVLCHGVLMYLEESRTMIRALATLACPGAIVSVLAKNAAALALRPALEGRYRDALAALNTDRDVGRLGALTRGDTIEELTEAFEVADIEPVNWYGLRLFTDHLEDSPPDARLPEVLKLEHEASGRDPYRSVARLLHLIGRKQA